MFKILLLLFLAWLAFRLIRAGRFVRSIMRNMEDAIAAAQEGASPGTADRRTTSDPPGKVTVHRKAPEGGAHRPTEVEDARFRDL